ncbi:MAG: hypothetical protein IPM81_20765 [Saprospirales bacterium]|nr:hypothetical protein [Saprospirales bacterium]
MTTRQPLYPGTFYHIYNRGNNHQPVFFERRDYALFLERCPRFIDPVAEVFAYCLLPNHFHLLVRIREEDTLLPVLEQKDKPFKPAVRTLPDFISDQFSNLFNSFTRTMNNRHDRDGNLFKRPFQRVEVGSDSYLIQLVCYIHFNPQKHGLIENFRKWRFSSYPALLSAAATRLQRAAVLEWFGGLEAFRAVHEGGMQDGGLGELTLEG